MPLSFYTMLKNHIYGLDSLRAFAAFTVVFAHIELLKTHQGLGTKYGFLLPDAHLGVILFFVISGFLITLLLLKEQESTTGIILSRFYMRRILRIWPLYYLLLLVSALLLHYTPGTDTLFMCLSIVPNIAYIIGTGWSASPQIWSIGVEEQFYLFWPTFLNVFRSRLLAALLALVVLYTLLPHVFLFVFKRLGQPDKDYSKLIYNFFYTVKFNCMALGAVLAYLIYRKPIVLDCFLRTPLSYVFICLPFAGIFLHIYIPYFTDELYAVLFCLLIANLSVKKYTFFNNRIVDYLGKISYGIYMYHWIVIVLVLKASAGFLTTWGRLGQDIYLHLVILGLTVLISALSYAYFESPFLELKKRFEKQ